ncbi:ABC transporter permease subunit [Paraconexibacter antarcticus]|uniref:ABC transporter permease subunit n=1 Tax=Paraconexibacter antarcticus TaxID=2949664 RepID=A0ABY5DYP9_9ACTN|nr:ABC transporter permease subunit [Paraconexibacter antarcticus]UTI66316.1 ABC transporter permease subunit [Paraconexibacter antarcticus]
MRPFVEAELRARARMIAGLATGAFTYLLVLALTYHSIGVVALGNAFGKDTPRIFTAFSGSRSTDVLSPHGWMGLGFNHPMLMITSLTAALAIGTGSVAGEVDSGRAQLLFTAPIARARFLGAALVVWAVAEVVILLAALGGAVFGGVLSPDLRHAGLASLAWAPLQLLPLTAFVAAVGVVASAYADTRGRALGLAVTLVVAAYLVSVVAGLSSALDPLRWATPFGYYDPGAAITRGLRPWPFLALTGAAVVLLLVARRRLARRDLA